MKIKLAILERDSNYLNRFVNTFTSRYAEEFEIHSFVDLDMAFHTLAEEKFDVFIVSDSFEIDLSQVPSGCGVAFLTESLDADTVQGKRTIRKFQKAELIYREILSIYEENSETASKSAADENGAEIIAFQPISGGCGASTSAAACAIHFAESGRRTLYLDLAICGSGNAFFEAEGQSGMSDVIFYIKSRETNLSLKVESCVRQDSSGVFFLEQSKVMLDMMELSCDDILYLITELSSSGNYDIIILDLDFGLDSQILKVLHKTDALVWVGDGSVISNMKLRRAFTALSILEEQNESSLVSRLALILNKYSNKTGEVPTDIDIRLLGGNPRYAQADLSVMLTEMAHRDMFDGILQR